MALDNLVVLADADLLQVTKEIYARIWDFEEKFINELAEETELNFSAFLDDIGRFKILVAEVARRRLVLPIEDAHEAVEVMQWTAFSNLSDDNLLVAIEKLQVDLAGDLDNPQRQHLARLIVEAARRGLILNDDTED